MASNWEPGKDAAKGEAMVFQENGRWVIFIHGLPGWIISEINKGHMPYSLQSQFGESQNNCIELKQDEA